MATDGPNPTSCDPDIFANGTQVLVTHSVPSNAMEMWVKTIAIVSGQRVDWHFAGGRAVVLAIGDIDKVYETIDLLTPVLDSARRTK